MAPLPPQSPRGGTFAAFPRAISFVTTTIPKSVASLIKRQSMISIPTSYSSLDTGPSPGTVVGIVLGSVGGFLLILWLLYSFFGGAFIVVDEGSVVVRERKHSHRTNSRRASETIEIRRERPRTPAVERVIVEETRETTRPARVVGSDITVSDEVVVIEEHSPPRRSKSKRDSGYRTVDPSAYAGGNRSIKQVRKSNRRSRN